MKRNELNERENEINKLKNSKLYESIKKDEAERIFWEKQELKEIEEAMTEESIFSIFLILYKEKLQIRSIFNKIILLFKDLFKKKIKYTFFNFRNNIIYFFISFK